MASEVTDINGSNNETVSLSVSLPNTQKIILNNVAMCDTFSKIKLRICDQIEKELGQNRRPDPELMRLMLRPWGPMLDDDDGDDDDDTRTLLDSLSSVVNSDISIEIIPHWVRFEDVFKEEEYEDEFGVDYQVEEFHSYKPLELPTNEKDLRIFGKLYSHRHCKRRRIRSVGGLRWPLKDITHLTSPAKVVMLALTENTFTQLDQYHISRRFETDAHDVLHIFVKWDKFSYLFLRKLRKCLPHVPIVALTDMDIRELELLTFLDTPPKEVPSLYDGWDLSTDCSSVGVNDNDIINIKWMGLRPCDFLDTSECSKHLLSASRLQLRFSFCSIPSAPTELEEFIKIKNFLQQHPCFCQKVGWVNELNNMLKLKYHPRLPLCAWKGYLSEKLRLQDWI